MQLASNAEKKATRDVNFYKAFHQGLNRRKDLTSGKREQKKAYQDFSERR